MGNVASGRSMAQGGMGHYQGVGAGRYARRSASGTSGAQDGVLPGLAGRREARQARNRTKSPVQRSTLHVFILSGGDAPLGPGHRGSQAGIGMPPVFGSH